MRVDFPNLLALLDVDVFGGRGWKENDCGEPAALRSEEEVRQWQFNI